MNLIELDETDVLIIRGSDASQMSLEDLRMLKDLLGCKSILFIPEEFVLSVGESIDDA